MEWRCAWCGKPHEEDDPPCDECGHHKFEQAIERVTDPEPDVQQERYVWACTECGREHQANSPPCSRCGNVQLERTEPDYDLEAVGGTSFLDVLEPKYAAGYVIAIALGVVLVLAFLGVISLPTIGGPPAPPDAPGYADSYRNQSLSAVENEYLATVNERRNESGVRPLVEDDQLTGIATYYNRRRVDSAFGNATAPTTDELEEAFDVDCGGRPILVDYTVPAASVDGAVEEGPGEFAAVLVRSGGVNSAALEDAAYDGAGIDVHVAPTGSAFVTALVC